MTSHCAPAILRPPSQWLPGGLLYGDSLVVVALERENVVTSFRRQ